MCAHNPNISHAICVAAASMTGRVLLSTCLNDKSYFSTALFNVNTKVHASSSTFPAPPPPPPGGPALFTL